jgi:hypothetical protein
MEVRVEAVVTRNGIEGVSDDGGMWTAVEDESSALSGISGLKF